VTTTTITSPREAESQIAEHARLPRTSAIACRALDIAISLLALVVLAPLLLVIAVAIRIDSRGPVLFRQERRGLQMRTFVVNKFRTMHPGCDNGEHVAFVQRLIAGETERHDSLFKLTRDDRVTRAGRILRKSSLDELPQLVNVLLGQMSLVGPRPCLDYELEKYPPGALRRFVVKPGITGLWQVSGRSQLTFEQMIALDLEYADHRSFWLNLQILVRTLPVVFLGRGAA
jgi:lipopolysaccharide/colanic/teichoic acid biosynthesis glycosyltransferase